MERGGVFGWQLFAFYNLNPHAAKYLWYVTQTAPILHNLKYFRSTLKGLFGYAGQNLQLLFTHSERVNRFIRAAYLSSGVFHWWGRRESNPWPAGYEPAELPLLHSPSYPNLLCGQSCAVIQLVSHRRLAALYEPRLAETGLSPTAQFCQQEVCDTLLPWVIC